MPKPIILITFHSIFDDFAINTNALLYNAVLLYRCLQASKKYRVAGLRLEGDLTIDKKAHRHTLMNTSIDFITFQQIKLLKPKVIIECMIDLNEHMWKQVLSMQSNIKSVRIRYGNPYYILSHDMIAQQHKYNNKEPEPETIEVSDIQTFKPEQLWLSPHFMRTAEFSKYFFHCEHIKEAPYLWGDWSVKRRLDGFNINPKPEHRKNILIMENNLHVIKNCTIPFTICEAVEQKTSNLLNKVTLTCVKYVIKHYKFKDFITRSKLMKHNKLNVLCSYIHLMRLIYQNNIGTVVSHNTHNELNYFHLECMNMGLMLVHNSECHKEYGFYYPKFAVDTGRDKLIEAITCSTEKIEEVKKGYKECIAQYSVDKKENLQKMEDYLDEI